MFLAFWLFWNQIFTYLFLYEMEQAQPAEGEGQIQGQIEVILEDAEPQAFEMILAYIYTDRIHPTKFQSNLETSSHQVTLLMMDVYRLALKVRFYRWIQCLTIHNLLECEWRISTWVWSVTDWNEALHMDSFPTILIMVEIVLNWFKKLACFSKKLLLYNT